MWRSNMEWAQTSMHLSLAQADDGAIYESMQYFFKKKNQKKKTVIKWHVERSHTTKFHSVPWVYWPWLR